MPSSREVSDSIHARERDIHRRARLAEAERELIEQSDREIEQAARATAAMDDAPLLPPLRTPMVTYDPADLTGIRVVPTVDELDIPAADPRGLTQALRHPVLWLLTGALWAVLGGLAWLVWRWVA